LWLRYNLQPPWQLVHVLKAWPKTNRFHVLLALSWAIAHNFRVPVRFYKTHDTRYMFEMMTKNSLFSIFYGHFHELLPIVLGFRDDLQGPRYSGTCLRDMYKKHCLHVLSSFCWAIAHLFGVLGQFTRPMTLGTCFKGMTKNSSFWVLWLCSWALAHNLWFRCNLQTPWKLVHV
jgi:hypothetical protein